MQHLHSLSSAAATATSAASLSMPRLRKGGSFRKFSTAWNSTRKKGDQKGSDKPSGGRAKQAAHRSSLAAITRLWHSNWCF
mmetsp:Transcript_12555/g.22210  ORF Transcript_12555/g.22210 Transcript_12555/m.22210 type:complete len:81 (-) Transcript_12555:89-331(-)